MKRILFCELCPFAYRLSTEKEILKRHLKDTLHKTRFAHERTQDSLPVVVYRHNSLLRCEGDQKVPPVMPNSLRLTLVP